MRSSPSCTSTCCANICGRPAYGQECRNMSMVRSSLGPFPDEWILSGLDRILYFCGINNVCELVDHIPGGSEYFLSTSCSESDECTSISEQRLTGQETRRISQSIVQLDSKDNIVKARSVSFVTLAETDADEKALEKSMENLQRSVSLVQQSLGNDTKNSKQTKGLSGSLKRSFSENRQRSGQTKLSKAKKSSSNIELTKSGTLNISALKLANNVPEGNGKLKTLYTSAEFRALEPAPENKVDNCFNELFSGKSAKPDCKQVAKVPPICSSPPPTCNKRGKYANLSPRHQQKLPRIIGTRWAMARINIFSDCSRTYEILEIKGRLPQAVIPCKTVVFFAVLPDGSTICYDYIKTKKRR